MGAGSLDLVADGNAPAEGFGDCFVAVAGAGVFAAVDAAIVDAGAVDVGVF